MMPLACHETIGAPYYGLSPGTMSEIIMDPKGSTYAFKSSTVHGAACLTYRLKILIPDIRN